MRTEVREDLHGILEEAVASMNQTERERAESVGRGGVENEAWRTKRRRDPR